MLRCDSATEYRYREVCRNSAGIVIGLPFLPFKHKLEKLWFRVSGLIRLLQAAFGLDLVVEGVEAKCMHVCLKLEIPSPKRTAQRQPSNYDQTDPKA